MISNYSGSYKNIEYSETLIREFTPGIYQENDIPEDLKQLQYGRIEIDFKYNGGGLIYFSPLMYYGSTNKNSNDDAWKNPNFIWPLKSDITMLFLSRWNICFIQSVLLIILNIAGILLSRYLPAENYTVIIDKKPEGMILQLKNGENIQNIFAHAYFPDSSQMFFKDVTSYTERNKGDSLKKVLMVGKGFAGIEKGIHEVNGQVTSLRVFKYSISNPDTGYELKQVRNQHAENEQVLYTPVDNLYGNDKFIRLDYQFYPYKFVSGELVPNGVMQTRRSY